MAHTGLESQSVALRRNRDFVLLQAGRLFSSLGTQSTSIAYPLLVLAVTHSAAKAGIVGFARSLPTLMWALPAGLAADQVSRKRLMIAADLLGLAAVGSLGAMVLTHLVTFWIIPVIAFAEGTGFTIFGAAQAGALRAVVPVQQLPAAAGAESGRRAAVQLAGPPLGGVLFGIIRGLPFLVDAGSYLASTASLLAMRTPFQEQRPSQVDQTRLGPRLAEGFRFIWAHPFLRVSALLFGLANFIGPGLLLCLVVVGRRQGLSPGAVSGLVAAFGACLLAGSFLSGLVRRLLPVRAVMLLELWTWTSCAAFLIWPSVYLLTAAMLPTALAIPSTDSVVHGYRVAMTPDHLLGRSESARSLLSSAITPLGPLVAGFLLDTSARAAIAVFAAAALVLALWGSVSPGLRAAPSLADLRSA